MVYLCITGKNDQSTGSHRVQVSKSSPLHSVSFVVDRKSLFRWTMILVDTIRAIMLLVKRKTGTVSLYNFKLFMVI